MKTIMLVAGETSGDQHGAVLVQRLKKADPTLQFIGVGGEKMAEAGVELLYPLANHAVVGIFEILKHARSLWFCFQLLLRELKKRQPDCLILIDYPGFNIRLAKRAHAMGITTLYYISPQVWAWKKNRIHSIKHAVDHMAVILPFEKKLYDEVGLPCDFVGHPLTEQVTLSNSRNNLRTHFGFNQHDKVIGMLPGSREKEIDALLPTMLASAEQLLKKNPKLQFCLPLANHKHRKHVTDLLACSKLEVLVVENQTYDLVACCDCVMICSGTATLETALLETPMVICYKLNWLTCLLASVLVRIDAFGLPNILAGRHIVPELFQWKVNAKNLSNHIQRFLSDTDHFETTRQALANLKAELIAPERTVDALVLYLLNRDHDGVHTPL